MPVMRTLQVKLTSNGTSMPVSSGGGNPPPQRVSETNQGEKQKLVIPSSVSAWVSDAEDGCVSPSRQWQRTGQQIIYSNFQFRQLK